MCIRDRCYSTDMRTWQRVESTTYDAAKGALCWDFDHSAAPSVIFSYFDLYPYERQLALVADCAAAGAAVGSLGQTLDGRELDVVQAVYNHLQWLHAPRASRRRARCRRSTRPSTARAGGRRR